MPVRHRTETFTCGQLRSLDSLAANLAKDVVIGKVYNPAIIRDLQGAGYLDSNLKPTACYSLTGPRPFAFTVVATAASGEKRRYTKHLRAHHAGAVYKAGARWADARFGNGKWEYSSHTDIPSDGVEFSSIEEMLKYDGLDEIVHVEKESTATE